MRKKWEDEAKKRMENQILSENITANNNIYYIENSCYEQTLDVYYPKNTTEDLPALIVVHGGGLFSSSKDETRFYCYMLAEKGFVVFNINYRLVPKVYLQNQIEDVYNAFCWIENNSNKYPIKTEHSLLQAILQELFSFTCNPSHLQRKTAKKFIN